MGIYFGAMCGLLLDIAVKVLLLLPWRAMVGFKLSHADHAEVLGKFNVSFCDCLLIPLKAHE